MYYPPPCFGTRGVFIMHYVCMQLHYVCMQVFVCRFRGGFWVWILKVFKGSKGGGTDFVGFCRILSGTGSWMFLKFFFCLFSKTLFDNLLQRFSSQLGRLLGLFWVPSWLFVRTFLDVGWASFSNLVRRRFLLDFRPPGSSKNI